MGVGLPTRHRRVHAGLGLAAALVIGALGWSAATHDEPPSKTTAAAPTTSATPEPAPVPRHLRDWLTPGSPLPGPGAGATVLDRVDDPVDGADSVGWSLGKGRSARWVLAFVRDGELITYSAVPADSGWLTFDQWLEDLSLQEEGAPGLVLASMGDDGTMTPVADGAQVVDQALDRDHRMGAFREERDSVFAVAVVRWEGHRWFVMSERYDGRSRTTTIAAARSGTTATTAEEFIAQYSELGKRP
jgi:hypothetical protein